MCRAEARQTANDLGAAAVAMEPLCAELVAEHAAAPLRLHGTMHECVVFHVPPLHAAAVAQLLDVREVCRHEDWPACLRVEPVDDADPSVWLQRGISGAVVLDQPPLDASLTGSHKLHRLRPKPVTNRCGACAHNPSRLRRELVTNHLPTAMATSRTGCEPVAHWFEKESAMAPDANRTECKSKP